MLGAHRLQLASAIIGDLNLFAAVRGNAVRRSDVGDINRRAVQADAHR